MEIRMTSMIRAALTINKIYRCKVICIFIGFLPILCVAEDLKKNTRIKEKEYYLSPYISVKQEFTNNARLDESNVNGNLTQISPGIRWISNTGLIKGFVDYSLDATVDSEGKRHAYISNRLNAKAVAEVIEQFAFIDISGSMSTQPISAFGQPVVDSRLNNNSTEVKDFKISPYLMGHFENNFDYEARYSIRNIQSGSKIIGDSKIQKIKLNLESPDIGKYLKWSALASYEDSDFKLRRNISTTTFRGALIYGVTSQIEISLIAGVESTDQISINQESHSISGFGGQWHPSQQTKFSIFGEKRYFGNAHNIAFEHRTRKTVWRYTDIKGISDGSNNVSATSGRIFDLLDGFYTQIEADPVQRTQLVLAEIERLGLTSETQVFKDFFRSENTLQRSQNLSLIFLGQRSTLTLSAFRLSNKKLLGSINLTGDFEKNEEIRQKGLSFLLSHRLSPNTSFFTNLNKQQNIGNFPGLKNQLLSLKFGINENLSRRTNLGFQLNRSLIKNEKSRYGETSLIGIITHRF